MTQKITLPNNWSKRIDQGALWKYMMAGLLVQLAELKKHGKIKTMGARAVEVAHRRWGKDDVALHFTACASQMRVGNYWHMLPTYNQCRKAVWDAVNPHTGIRRIDEAFPHAIREYTNKTEMKIGFLNGSSWQLVGSDSYNSIVGATPIGLTVSEWALANPLSWVYVAPMLEENKGWAMFISTSRGRNHLKSFYDMARRSPHWFADMKKASQTEVFTPEQLERIKTEYIEQFGDDMGLAAFLQEYECSFEGVMLGSYYSKQMTQARSEGRICSVPHRPDIEVNTYWDLGLDDSMTIWFVQHIGQQHRVIDYLENTGMGLEWYAKEMKKEHRVKYIYGNHYMPHDANEREMTNSEFALSRREVAENLGIKPVMVVPRARNMDVIVNVHIPAVRTMLSSCWFDEKKCDKGITSLENYHAKYDEEKKVLTKRPEHDHNSHAADGMRTMAVGFNRTVGTANKSVTEMMHAKRGNIYNG